MSLLDRWRTRQPATVHSTITERTWNMTTETIERPANPAKQHHATSDALGLATKLRTAVAAVDRLALASPTFPTTREWFGRADQLAAELDAIRAADETARADLVEALADGSVTAGEAATRALELARADSTPSRGADPGHDVVTAAADLAVNRAVAAARSGEAAEAMILLRTEGEHVARAAAQLPVPSGALASFGYNSREGETWDRLMRLLERWEATVAAAIAVRRAVGRDAGETLVEGAGGMVDGRPVHGWVKVAPKGWELPPLEAGHVLLRAYAEGELRDQAVQERAAEQSRKEADEAFGAALSGGKMRHHMRHVAF